MLSTDALVAFRKRLRKAQLALKTLSVHDGVAAMVSFYQDVRADDCELDDDGDMLLVQWGPEVVKNHSAFKVDVTRQFMSPEQDGEILQLSLTFSFPLDADLEKVKGGDQWFETPGDAWKVKKLVGSRKVFQLVAGRTDARVKLTFEPT